MSTNALVQALSAPERVTLELTNHCNLNCPFCPRQHMDYPLGFMDSDLFRRLVDELAALGTTTLVPFFRGEPLLHRDCLVLLAYAKAKSFTIQLATNGQMLTEEIARSFVEMGIDFVSFSVDAIHPDTYRERRRGGTFAQMLKGVDSLLQARQAAGTQLPHIQVSAVDTGMGRQEKEDFVAYWQSRVDHIRIYPQHTKDGRFGSLDAPADHLRQPCLKPFKEMVVYWDGHLAICNHDWNRSDGQRVTETTIQETWGNAWYADQRMRQRHLNFSTEELCAACGHWPQYCGTPRTVGEIYS